MFATVLHASCAIAIREHPRPLIIKNYIDFIASISKLQRTFFLRKTTSFRCSITVRLLLSAIPTEGPLPTSGPSKVQFSKLSALCSLFAPKFMQGCHADRYPRLVPSSPNIPRNNRRVIYWYRTELIAEEQSVELGGS